MVTEEQKSAALHAIKNCYTFDATGKPQHLSKLLIGNVYETLVEILQPTIEEDEECVSLNSKSGNLEKLLTEIGERSYKIGRGETVPSVRTIKTNKDGE